MNIIRKSGSLFLWANLLIWSKLPKHVRRGSLGLTWGRFIFYLVGLQGGHVQLETTYFFRNRAELKLLGEITAQMNGNVDVLVVGCSEGAEVLSILHTINKAQPELKTNILAFDISESALAIARKGSYLRNSRLFKYTRAIEIEELFSRTDDTLTVNNYYMEKIQWRNEDPTREPVRSSLSKQDIVFINRLLFHMSKSEAERCLRAAASLVRRGGFLFVSGVDLDLRSRLAQEYGWRPITKYLEEIHSGDETMTMDWPFKRWGLEPLNKKRKDWALRYCSVFQLT